MRMYSTGTNGIWIVFGFLIFAVVMVITLGGFLLGTPIGLALLTFIVIRSVYRNFKRKKMMNEYEQSGGATYGNPFGNAGGFTGFSREEEPRESQAYEEETVVNREDDGFAAKYRDVDSDQKIFTTEDLRNAVDVEFEEVQ